MIKVERWDGETGLEKAVAGEVSLLLPNLRFRSSSTVRCISAIHCCHPKS